MSRLDATAAGHLHLTHMTAKIAAAIMKTVSRSALAAITVVIVLVAIDHNVRAADDDVAALLARPVSPGTLATLMPHAKDQRVLERWRRSLWHADPRVRGVAARLLQIAGATLVAPSLQQVLTTETDPAAALEIACALLALGGSDANAAVLAAAGRLPPGPLALAIAQARGRVALVFLDEFRAMKMTMADRIRITRAVARGSRSDLEGVAVVALESGDGELWESVLWVAREDSITIEARVFEAACASSSSRIRDYAWWHVAVFLAENQPITTLVREWLSKEAAGGGGDPILSFGRELAARALSYTPMENDGLIARLGKESDDPPLPAPFWGFLEGPLFRFLTAAEQNAVNSRRPEPQHRTAKEALVVPPRDKSYGTYRTMRTVSNLPYGLALDLAQQMGCKPGDKEEVAGAVVRYDEARVLRAIEYIETTLEKPCAPTARYLSWISATPPPIEMIPEQKEIMLLPMHKTFLTCLDGPPPSNAAPATGPIPLRSAGIVAPRKTKMVNPIYPASAQMARRQGFVVIEATISPAGCVTRGEVRHSIAPDLDVSAMRAVTGWKFTPTLVDGKPMPVVMTVTVQFMLR